MKRIFIIIMSVPLTALMLLGIGLAFYELTDFFGALHEQRPDVFANNTSLWLSTMVMWIVLMAVFTLLALALQKMLSEQLCAFLKKPYAFILSAMFIGGLFLQIGTMAFASNIIRIIAIEHGYLYCAAYQGFQKENNILMFTKNADACTAFRESGLSVKAYEQETDEKYQQD